VVISLERGANDLHNDPAHATAIHCFIKIHIGLTSLVPAYPGRSGKEVVKWVSVLRCRVSAFASALEVLRRRAI